jgi:8-oxo-dGTP pyrophosphatase MutT (NUDIX family)
MRRFPFLYPLISRLIGLFAARFTVGVTGVVFNERGEILLLEHVFRGRYPWGLPGGWVNRHERPQDALRRELIEEVGLPVRVGPPLLVDLDDLPGHLETAFLCEVEGEVGLLSNEILAARWIPPDALPDGLKPLDREMVKRALRLRRGGNAPSRDVGSARRGEGVARGLAAGGFAARRKAVGRNVPGTFGSPWHVND